MPDSGEDRLAAAREALRRHAWREAFDQLSAADAAEPLAPEDLERLAEAAQWIGRLDDCIAVHARAHAAYLERGNQRRAGFVALLIAHAHFAKGKASMASGWMRRAERLLEAEQDSIEYGHLLRARGLLAKDPDEAFAHARAAHELATRFGDRDLAARQVQELGRLLVAKGEVAEGLALIEAATVTAARLDSQRRPDPGIQGRARGGVRRVFAAAGGGGGRRRGRLSNLCADDRLSASRAARVDREATGLYVTCDPVYAPARQRSSHRGGAARTRRGRRLP